MSDRAEVSVLCVWKGHISHMALILIGAVVVEGY